MNKSQQILDQLTLIKEANGIDDDLKKVRKDFNKLLDIRLTFIMLSRQLVGDLNRFASGNYIKKIHGPVEKVATDMDSLMSAIGSILLELENTETKEAYKAKPIDTTPAKKAVAGVTSAPSKGQQPNVYPKK